MRAVSVVHMLLRRGDCHDNAHFPTVVIVASSTDSTGTILSLQLVLLGLYRLRLPASNQNSVPVSPTPVLCVAVLGLLALCIGRLVSALAAFSVPVDVTHLYFCTAPQFDASHKLPVPIPVCQIPLTCNPRKPRRVPGYTYDCRGLRSEP